MQNLPKASANQRTSYPVQLLTYIMYTYLRIKHAQTHIGQKVGFMKRWAAAAGGGGKEWSDKRPLW